MIMKIIVSIVASLSIASASTGFSADLKVLSTPTMKTSLDESAGRFEAQTGHHLSISFEGVPALKRRIEAGEQFDVAILTRSVSDELARDGKIDRDSIVNVARTGAGLAVRAGAPKPDIRTEQGLRETLLKAKAISYSADSASGTYFLSLLKRLKIEDEIKGKLVAMSHRSPVDAVATGEAEMTIITVPNIIGVNGVEIGGLLPTELQNYTVFDASISKTTTERTASQSLINFLLSPFAVETMVSKGLESVSRK
jgi:molybdate transport system substrate-binding protein